MEQSVSVEQKVHVVLWDSAEPLVIRDPVVLLVFVAPWDSVGQLDLLVLVEQWDFAGPLDRAVLRVLRDLVEHLVSAALLDL